MTNEIPHKCESCFHWNIGGCHMQLCQYEEKLSRQLLTDEIYEQMDCNCSEENGQYINRGLEQVLNIMHRISSERGN